MPTGYTAPIEDRDGYTFAEYLWSCARAFDIACRDSNGPPPFKHDPWTEHDVKRLAELEAERTRLRAMTKAEQRRWAEAEHARAVAAHESYKASERVKRERYAAMRAQVEAWTPPTALHEGLREFMISQINLCTPSTDAEMDRFGPKAVDFATAHAERLERCTKQIDSTRTSIAQAVQRAKDADEWVEALHKATPQP